MTDDVWDLFEDLRGGCAENAVKAVVGESRNAKDGIECEFCGSIHALLDGGNYICQDCDAIVCRFIDTTAEWRYFGGDDARGADPTRCGLPVNELLPDSSLGSIIGFGGRETHIIRIMRKYHMWNSMSYKERTLYNVFDTLTVNAMNSGISKSILDEAKMLYKKLSETKLSRGESRSGLIASSIYMSCKTNKVPRSAKEIAKIFNLKVTTMTKGCKRFQELMKMNMESTAAVDFVFRFCSRLSFDKQKRDMCMNVVVKSEELGVVSENTPPSIAAGSIYLCNMLFDWGVNKKEMAAACEISQVTILKCYKRLLAFRRHLFPEEVAATFM